MTGTPKSPWREHAEEAIRVVLHRAKEARWKKSRLVQELRRRRLELLEEVTPVASYSAWRRALRTVTGTGIRDLPDPRQEALPFARVAPRVESVPMRQRDLRLGGGV